MHTPIVPPAGPERQFVLRRMAVGGDDLAGERIGGLAQLDGQGIADHRDGRIRAVLPAQQLGAGLGVAGQVVRLVIAEDRHALDQLADAQQFVVRHVGIDGGCDHHGVDQRALGRNFGHVVSVRLARR